MKKIWNGFFIAFAMFSKIPVPKADWSEDNMKYMVCFFPGVGAAIGLFIYGWQYLAGYLGFGAIMRAAGFVLIPVAVTGGIHLDGFLDTMDAISSWQPRERKLEILKDSHAGAFAVIMGCAYFLLSLGVWSEMDAAAFPVICLGFVVSRALSGMALTIFPKANEKGSLAKFSDTARKKVVRRVLGAELLVCAALAVYWSPGRAVLMGIVAVLVYWHYHHMAMKEFGGTTGDIAGYFVEVIELAMALAVMLGGRFL